MSVYHNLVGWEVAYYTNSLSDDAGNNYNDQTRDVYFIHLCDYVQNEI